jgi:hypothetical protein
MNERLEKFAKQAPLLKSYDYPDLRLVDDDQLERFAELVRADEREACAKLCDDWFASTAGQAIRERGNK